ncbi:hypothetical protein Geu3261_0269_001 [Komagataeibacter europaeus NBRC 3261]|uniref:Uncharacterized protein n=1 Tax=Komagataeibacter europaeus NBRC 3261 TaxID=1234669 RepID=A0A0D6Q319_KOMEU|nr:hypothetical protein [Komagataeibacter europaeus]GAN97829.1 hypothetical protein Geu3261_0269_001 [Komagataeibacter europaeus NBRC 3261]
MDGQLTASLRLTLQDDAAPAFDKLIATVDRLEATLDRLAGAIDPLAAMLAPITRATAGAEALEKALKGTAGSAKAAGEAGEAMGAEVAESATRATTALRGFEEMLDSIATAEGTVSAASSVMGDSLIDVIVRGAEPLGEALDAAGAQGQVMGDEIAGGAARATTAMDGLLARVRQVREQMAGMAAGVRDGAIGGAVGGVREAASGFSGSLQNAMHHGMTAAMATVGMLEPIHAAAEYDNTLVHIGIGNELHGEANRAFVVAYGRQLDALARDTGQRGTDLAEAAGFYNREGYSADRVNAVMPTTAHIATAYNAAPDAVARSAFSLQESLHITDQQLGGALASVALAGKSADLPFEKLGPVRA